MSSKVSITARICFWASLCTRVFGANATTCDSGDQPYTISSQDDADALQNCLTFTGDISIIGTEDTAQITLGGVQDISGWLVFNTGWPLETFIATDLVTLGNGLKVYEHAVRNMTFSSLTTIGYLGVTDNGTIKVLDFPAGLSKWSTIIDSNESFKINGTAISTLSNIKLPSINFLWITNNENLQSATIKTQSIGVDPALGSVDISGNGVSSSENEMSHALNLSFPTLTKMTGNNQISNLSELQLPELSVVNGTLIISDIDSSTLSFPALTTALWTGVEDLECLTIKDSQLDSIGLPVLGNISTLTFAENQGLLYNNLALPSLAHANTIVLEKGNRSYPGLNCSSFSELVCNGTVAAVECLNGTVYNNTVTSAGCPPKNSGINQSVSIGSLLLSTLFSLAGAAVAAGVV